MSRDDLVEAIREFTGTILNPYDVSELLHRLTGHAMAVVDAAGAGIMLEDGSGELRFAAASDDRVVDVEVAQQRIESGACFEAFTTNSLVVVDDMEEDDRWPEYRDRVVKAGLRGVVGVPMNAFGQTIGVINVYREYREHVTPWTDDDVRAAEIMASMGAGYIVNANQMRAQHDLTEQLHTAIDSRDLIGQAKGVLMARKGIDADEAFELLRSASQSGNKKLRDIARLVVEHRDAL